MPFYFSFEDMKKAFDSVNREALWMVLQRRFGFPDELIRVLRAIHWATKGAVRAYEIVLEEFDISN